MEHWTPRSVPAEGDDRFGTDGDYANSMAIDAQGRIVVGGATPFQPLRILQRVRSGSSRAL